MNNKSTIRVEIFGNEYFIKIDETTNEKHIKEVAAFVDKKMREITQATSIVSSTKVAILAALNIADEFIRSRKDKKEETEKAIEEKANNIIQLLNEIPQLQQDGEKNEN